MSVRASRVAARSAPLAREARSAGEDPQCGDRDDQRKPVRTARRLDSEHEPAM